MNMESEIDAPYALDAGVVEGYRQNGFARLPDVFSADLLAEYKTLLTNVVRARDQNTTPLSLRDTYGRAFTQIFNLWRDSLQAELLMRSRRLAGIAAQLMGVDSVRLYHDQALFKESGGGRTPWHCDQVYWPLDNDNTVTAWIPLQAVPAEMGPLCFASGSHREMGGRKYPISDASETRIAELMASFSKEDRPFQLGAVSFHSGWTYHCAPGNRTNEVRSVYTIIYMDARSRLIEPDSEQRKFDAKMWCPGIHPGSVIDSPINPVLITV
jgi:ectoine hydroxylase-related dioxygenase (phytanoyl-CoA dioxygenase family)